MGLSQEGTVVICVSRGESGRWDVSENEYEDPLASFDDKQDACDYANRLTMTRQGASMVVLNAGSPSSMQARDSLRR